MVRFVDSLKGECPNHMAVISSGSGPCGIGVRGKRFEVELVGD